MNQESADLQLNSCGLSPQLLQGLPNNTQPIKIASTRYPSSVLELHRPTGKYVSRLLIKLFNAFSQKGVIRTIGNACAPGLMFPQLIENKGIDQFENLDASCPIVSANILGYKEFPQSVSVKAEPFMVLKINETWKSFNDYLGAFSSKYRVRTKKVLSETSHFEKRYLHELPTNEWIALCGSLLSETLQDKTIAIGRNLPQLLACYHKSLGDNYKVLGFYEGDTLVGFISYIRDNSKLFAMHLGINRNSDASGKLYQRMLYSVVEEAIISGLTYVNLGRTGAEIKSTLGAVPIQNSFVVFTKSKIMLTLFRIYVKYFQKTYNYTYRSPFKEAQIPAEVPISA